MKVYDMNKKLDSRPEGSGTIGDSNKGKANPEGEKESPNKGVCCDICGEIITPPGYPETFDGHAVVFHLCSEDKGIMEVFITLMRAAARYRRAETKREIEEVKKND